MRHPILLLILLFLSMFHVTRRYIWTASTTLVRDDEYADDQQQQQQQQQARFLQQTTKRNSSANEQSVDRLHQSIPRNVDKPVSFDDEDGGNTRSGNPFLQTLASTRPGSHLHAPYALWAHGHLLFLHHTLHGYSGMRDEVGRFDKHNIPVDAIVLDAYWWHPARILVPHPQLYSQGWNAGGGGAERSTRVVLWVSALVPTSSNDYIEGRQHDYFLHRGDERKNHSATPHIFEWDRKDGPALHGALVDFTNRDAVRWLAEKFETLLRENAQVYGVRCAGVDALVEHTTDLFGGIGHIDSSLYRSLYYRFFLDIGRRVRGPLFLMMGRAVDSFGTYHYQKFAPRDSLFAGFVGDHPFTFSGLRESTMNVIHSAYHCYVNVGVVVGGSYVNPPTSEEEFHDRDEEAALVDLGVHDSHQLSNRLQRAYKEAELFPLNVDSVVGTKCSSIEVRTKLRQQREQELFLRWIQFGSSLPFLINGGGDRYNNLLGSSSLSTAYRMLVQEHRALALYYSTEAIDSLDHFFDSEFHYQNVPFKTKTSKLKSDPRAQHCSIMPLRKIPVSFAEPTSADLEWALRVGDHLVVIPVLHSFGNTTRHILLKDLVRDLDVSLLNVLGNHTSAEWVLVSDIRQVFLLDGTTKHNNDKAAVTVPLPSGAPLVLRRRDAIIPLIQPIADVAGTLDSVAGVSLVVDDAIVFSVDVPRRASADVVLPPITATTRTTLTGEGASVIPAMQATVSRRAMDVDDAARELLSVTVKFISDENDSNNNNNENESSWSSWIATDGISTDDDESMKLLWDPSLRFVVAYSEAASLDTKAVSATALLSSPPSCRCVFDPESLDEDHTRADVECRALQEEQLQHHQPAQFLHERHHAADSVRALFDNSTLEEDEALLRCVVSTRLLHAAVRVQQVVVLSPIHGEVHCSCSQW
jgi:hypothetical protein